MFLAYCNISGILHYFCHIAIFLAYCNILDISVISFRREMSWNVESNNSSFKIYTSYLNYYALELESVKKKLALERRVCTTCCNRRNFFFQKILCVSLCSDKNIKSLYLLEVVFSRIMSWNLIYNLYFCYVSRVLKI
jgi:hypothetical protein